MSAISLDLLQVFAETVSEGLKDRGDPVLLRVTGDSAGSPEFAMRPFGSGGVEDVLVGFTAPESWLAAGLHATGYARRLDAEAGNVAGTYLGDHSMSPGADGADSAGGGADVAVTVVMDRSGNGAGVLRRGDMSIQLTGLAHGFLSDTFRRVLGLPTPSAPLDTVELWVRTWLDRLADSIAFLGNADRYTNWASVAAIHPAGTATEQDSLGPFGLAYATHELAGIWPWSRLHEDPEAIDTPRLLMSRDVAAWMDDGMFARCALASVPTLEQLVGYLRPRLFEPVTSAIRQTVIHCGLAWPTSP